MSQDNKRLALFFFLALGSFFAINEISIRLGLIPRNPPKPRPPVVARKDDPAAKAPPATGQASKKDEEAGKKVKVTVQEGPRVGPVDPKDLVLGSIDPKQGYRLRLQLQQEGAGVHRLSMADYEAEHIPGRPKSTRLELIQPDPNAPPSFSLSLIRPRDPKADEDDPMVAAIVSAPTPTSEIAWEVVRDAKGRAVRPILDKQNAEVGQELIFRTALTTPMPVTLTKKYRVRKGANEFGFEMELGFEGPVDQTLSYQLMGPHNLPIEGEWYTGTFREVYFGQVNKGSTQVETRTADAIVKAQADPEKFSSIPLKFAGVENQFFTVMLEPSPVSKLDKDRRDAEAHAAVIHPNGPEPQKSDVSFLLTSRPIEVGPNRSIQHAFKVFAGPKDAKLLAAYGAEELASYRKGSNYFFIPGAGFMAQTVISPMLDHTYNLTYQVAKVFGGTRGNYGVSIILLTMLVRLCLFPLGRKMAISAKKMQELAPHLKGLQEKYKDDKERITKETFALYREHKVNPVAGCLPALIQMPILVGLWQALNNSPALRHAQFLWINDLSAPDMLFKMPFDLPWIGPYFNLLPLAVVGLMMLQTKLFAPPATTPEAEMQQKMMKYMMIVMAVMFYKVPSGLGFYFITSSLWQIGERLILPKTTAVKFSMFKADPTEPGDGPGRPPGSKPPSPGKGPKDRGPEAPKPAPAPAQRGWLDDLRDRVGQLMDEAQHERTTRNSPSPNRDPGRDRNRPRPKPGKRR